MTLTRTPARIPRRRTPGEVVAALGAWLALAGLVGGVPAALLAFVGPPVPAELPTLGELTRPLGTGSLLAILAVVVWLAWLQLLACVVVEFRAAVRGVGLPVRLPLSAAPQALARKLVSTALLLFTVTIAVVPTVAAPRDARPAYTTAAHVGPAPGKAALARAPAGVPAKPPAFAPDASVGRPERIGEPVLAEGPRIKKIYRVQPPRGRHHDNLWDISERFLGDGRRYNEIFALNQGRTQPDGTRLTKAGLIRPGWILELPADAVGAETVLPRAPRDIPDPRAPQEPPGRHADPPDRPGPPQRDQPGTPGQRQPGAPGQREPESPGQREPESPGQREPGEPGRGDLPGQPAPSVRPQPGTPHDPALPGAPPATRPADPPARTGPAEPPPARTGPAEPPPATRPAEPPPGATRPADPPATDAPGRRFAPRPEEPGLGIPLQVAAASLLAAGVLAALARRRRAQLAQRPSGHRIRRPEGEAAALESALRLGADEPGTRLLDLGLRQLSYTLATQGRALPTVFAAHVGTDNLDLWISPPDPEPPAPWTALDQGQVWRLPVAAGRKITPEAMTGVLAPYPGLVSIGTNPTGRILVDLEVAHGLIAVKGPDRLVRAGLASLAVELATNRWSDDMRLTLVGLGSELTLVAPERVRVVETFEEAVAEFERRVDQMQHALAALGADSVLTGRLRGVNPSSWVPHYLIMATPPTPDQARRLLRVARTGHRVAAGYVVAGDLEGATWSWEISPEGRLHAGVLGFDVHAQLIAERHYTALVELFRTATRFDAVPLPARAEPVGAPAAPQVPLGPPGPGVVEVRILGRARISAPGAVEPDRRALCTEVVVYLATHPDGVHPTVLGGAIWPRGVSPAVRDATIARVQDWLGGDQLGRPNLVIDMNGRIRLGSQVRVDWNVFQALVGHAATLAGQAATDPEAAAAEAADLARALALVRGPLLEGRESTRYSWLAREDLEYDAHAWVADAAYRLAEIRATAGDHAGAVEAARAGLRLADDEELWRMLLRATHATGAEGALGEVVGELRARAAEHGTGLDPRTEALLDELQPSWRAGGETAAGGETSGEAVPA